MAEQQAVSWESLKAHTFTFSTTAAGTALQADIYPPSGLPPGPHPLVIAYHGGGLIAGGRSFFPFQAAWLPAYASNSNAIIISPDYRKLPQASGREIIDDVNAFWSWLHDSSVKGFQAQLTHLEPTHSVDSSRILIEGGSAGGFCAAHLMLSHPDEIRAAILIYPALDNLRSKESPSEQKIFPRDQIPPREEMLAWIEAENVRGETLSRGIDAMYFAMLFVS